MKIGFIGCGNMATAIINGLLNDNKNSEISAFDVNDAALNNIGKLAQVNICNSNCEVVNASDVVILAVKPNMLQAVLTQCKDALAEKSPLLISIAAGKTLAYLETYAGANARIIRVMPNINAKVLEAMSGYCGNKNIVAEDKIIVEAIFSSIGNITAIDESYFPLFGVIAGCSPAFVYMFIDAMATSAVQNGMNKQLALKIAAQSVLGSAKMILDSDEHPAALIDKVCSPGGTTIEGVASLKHDGFESTINNAITKALEKDSKI